MDRQAAHALAPSRRQMLSLLGASVATAAFTGPLRAQPTFPNGAVIRTLFKDYQPQELIGGATLFHEHMSLREGFLDEWNGYSAQTRAANRAPNAPPPPARPAPSGPQPPSPNFMQDEDLMVAELTAAKNDGIGCIVDAGHPDMGRDVNFLRKISQRSGLPIVASAGFYTQPFYPKALSGWSEQQVVDELMKQVRANPTGALGEIGSWDYITADERKVFRAIGKVHQLTNLPIFTHTGIPGKSALEQLDILEDAGVDPHRVVIGHLGNLVDETTEIHRAIIRRGAFIGFDRQGNSGDTRVVPMVKSLIEMGYADHLMFSSDLSANREILKNGGDGYGKTVTKFLPLLVQAGVDPDVLHKIMHENPLRFLAFVPKIPRSA